MVMTIISLSGSLFSLIFGFRTWRNFERAKASADLCYRLSLQCRLAALHAAWSADLARRRRDQAIAAYAASCFDRCQLIQ